MAQNRVAHNNTLKHAPIAERMIGHIGNHIIDAMKGTGKKWWEVVDGVVNVYNEKHANRNALMTPTNAAKWYNIVQAKTQLEGVRETSDPQPRIDPSDKVKVIIGIFVREGLHAKLE